ncbi:hypothetical protein Mapa_013147 [Marchantia paleacea]|nr:hypothetical protein Mapa_013147 [Marchantia paleacea]
MCISRNDWSPPKLEVRWPSGKLTMAGQLNNVRYLRELNAPKLSGSSANFGRFFSSKFLRDIKWLDGLTASGIGHAINSKRVNAMLRSVESCSKEAGKISIGTSIGKCFSCGRRPKCSGSGLTAIVSLL